MPEDSDASSTNGNQNGNQPRDADGRTVAEWVTLIVSALIVMGLMSAALIEHFWRDEPSGVRLEATLSIDQARRVDDVFYIPFTVRNTGSDGAENVAVAFTVREGGQAVEESSIEIAFLGNSGSTRGELVTRYDPATHDIDARISTFETP